MVILGLLLALVVWWSRLPPDPKILEEARRALDQRRPADALQLATNYLRKAPQSVTARLYAAKAAESLGQREQALEFLQPIPAEDSSEEATQAAQLAGKLYLAQGRAWTAEQSYRRVVQHRPRDVDANRQMVVLLTIEGRRWESRPFLLELVSQQQDTLEELIVLGDIWPDYEFRAELDRLRNAQPRDPLPYLGLARMAAHKQETIEARLMLQRVIAEYPDLVEAHAWLGWTLVQDREGPVALGKWEKELPVAAADHPMIWLVRGMGAEHLGQREAAARCFGEALRLDPNYDLAASRLSHALSAVGQTEAAKVVGRRSDLLLELAARLKLIYSEKQHDVETFRLIARKMESLGRLREAWAWYQLVAAQDPKQAETVADAERLQDRLKSGPFLSLAEAQPDLKLDVARYPLPKWPDADRPAVAYVRSGSSASIRFVDSAAATGIDFTYFNGDLPGQPRVLGDVGGGVGILDYDGDSWPDIYFTQGADWPIHAASTMHRDRLFRNLGNGKFEDVTEFAGLGDNTYSHGVSIGDFDNDGFPDLYLGNCGMNRLYHNNGDGTFTDNSSRAGIVSNDWTTSCLIADLSGDGWPDLFDVNYLGGDALTRSCAPRECGPYLFPGQQDRLLLSNGDGTFSDVTGSAGIQGKDGKGLGIVAADFAAAGRLSLFIANDTTPNFFYENVAPSGKTAPLFSENGIPSGLAHDRNGFAQACMGVAADDANGDGFLELFVTNFYNESNTFYLPEIPGKSYSDQTAEFGLREGSLQMLGFGTQFIDGELDGWPDLILTNGHVHHRPKEGIPYEMRPQYYQNLAGKSFEELLPESLGQFFSQKRLGRGLARIDWNRDGREDVVISHIDSPAALLTNQTTPCGHFLVLQLRGVQGSRDAIGTICELQAGQRKLTRQLTAGDGYLASNQRQLVFGIGEATHIDKLSIRWPGGATQTYTNLAVDAEYIAIEGREALVTRVPPSP
ncbi:MAG: FG-GAP-like repeat-containing protein [Pirellulaceae bacterium]